MAQSKVKQNLYQKMNKPLNSGDIVSEQNNTLALSHASPLPQTNQLHSGSITPLNETGQLGSQISQNYVTSQSQIHGNVQYYYVAQNTNLPLKNNKQKHNMINQGHPIMHGAYQPSAQQTDMSNSCSTNSKLNIFIENQDSMKMIMEQSNQNYGEYVQQNIRSSSMKDQQIRKQKNGFNSLQNKEIAKFQSFAKDSVESVINVNIRPGQQNSSNMVYFYPHQIEDQRQNQQSLFKSELLVFDGQTLIQPQNINENQMNNSGNFVMMMEPSTIIQTDIHFIKDPSMQSHSLLKMKTLDPFSKDEKPFVIHHRKNQNSSTSSFQSNDPRFAHLYQIVKNNKNANNSNNNQNNEDYPGIIQNQNIFKGNQPFLIEQIVQENLVRDHENQAQKRIINKSQSQRVFKKVPASGQNVKNFNWLHFQDSFKNIKMKAQSPLQEEKQKKKEDDKKRVKNFMIQKFTEQMQQNIEVNKKNQQKVRQIDIKRAQGFFSPSKFLETNRNTKILNSKPQRHNTIEQLPENNQNPKNLFSQIKGQQKYLATELESIQDEDTENDLNEQSQQKHLLKAPVSRLFRVNSDLKTQLPSNNQPQNNNIYYDKNSGNNFMQKIELLKHQTDLKKLSRNQIIDINDIQQTITHNTLSSKKSSVDQGQIQNKQDNHQRLLSATTAYTAKKNQSQGKNQWSIIDYMYQGVATSPMNQQERIQAISKMSRAQLQSAKSLKFNKNSKIQIKYLANKQQTEPLENVVDELRNIVCQQPKEDFREVSIALGNYIQSSQALQRPQTQQINNEIKNQNNIDNMKSNGGMRGRRVQTANLTNLQGLLRRQQSEFFDQNFALKEKESESLKIEYLRLQKDAIELNRKQAQSDLVSLKSVGRESSQPSKKAKLLIDLI